MHPAPAAELTLAQARRVALRAQGLDRPRPAWPAGRPHLGDLHRVVDRLGLLQIDSVNVLARAHLVPLFSRLGPYDTGLLDRATSRAPRRLVETWAHEASFVPPETYRFLAWRRREHAQQAWGSIRSVARQHPEVVDEVRALVRDAGPVSAREAQAALAHDHPRPRDDWGWNWSVTKRALELLFFTGEVAVAARNGAFERLYDLTERVVPAPVLARPEPDDAECFRALVEIGARAHGIGTVRCFADYFRLRGPRVGQAVAELVEDGVLLPVQVRSWDRRVYLHRDASVPRAATGRALLSPFDPLIFERRRLEELFGTRYRIEIYVPAAQRVHGYYVLPLLLGDAIAARVDLRADRRAGVLEVPGAYLEPGAPGHAPAELVAELRLLAGWLGLDSVVVPDGARGDLAGVLRPVLGTAP
ncbi:winged helix-turn-helix domain-containing protein [Actinotalea sp. Marseille-Q4924]|uniref:winged helix-turn-helix domain-containing protein n=1 Tax=Actinotalea sp. Marseille-Q4924 TaxID=2866571 RepID=UPI001CE3BC8B|nr:crosslink repair DNA glycosylase YcaQ family protein [Actinotalea sp. Marseille-Q4924]